MRQFSILFSGALKLYVLYYIGEKTERFRVPTFMVALIWTEIITDENFDEFSVINPQIFNDVFWRAKARHC